MRTRLIALISVVYLAAGHAADYSGSGACRSCHESEHARWQESHHFQAMAPAGEDTVLGDFSGVPFEYAGITSRFYREDGRYMVETDNEKGALQAFEIAYTFGFEPLQQYLIAFPGGRYQALNIVWDNRPDAAGGQRWVHLYPDEAVTHGDGLHWTGSFQNWNARCAACHSTDLRRNYSAASNSYKTTWSEINVACEACHGPASDHLAWAANQSGDDAKGFAFRLSDRGPWGPGSENEASGAAGTLNRTDGKRPSTQVEMCAGCHSRRSEMDEDHPNKPFSDLYQLRLLEEGMYFPDGQIDDEVYVYGSFLQSKMQQAGVVCTDCHEPHSNRVLAQDNALCTRCHSGPTYDSQDHHRHAAGGPGARCVNCHMPERTYMVVDDRRDHSFRVPEPKLTRELGTPNACNSCHEDRDAAWALSALEGWGIPAKVRAKHAMAFARARQNDPAALPDLLAIAADENLPGIIRATASLETGRFPARETLEAAARNIASPDPLLRAATVSSLDWLPPQQRYAMLRTLIGDKSKSVRVEVARQLADVPTERLPEDAAGDLMRLRQEYLETLQLNSDMPEAQLNLANFYAATGDSLKAEEAYLRAIGLSPAFTPALMNLADLYRANGMDDRARPLLAKAIEIAPEQAEAHHAMGLLLVREQEMAEALVELRRAAELQPGNPRFSYVYGVALYENGAHARAIAVLEEALRSHPGNREIVSALASYYQQQGNTEKLRALMESRQGW